MRKTTTQDNFRLLRLSGPRQGVTSSDLSGTRRTCQLSNPQEFDCISYVWANESASSTIWLDDYPVNLTKSLETVLRQLQEPHKPSRLLWADALCIEQKDPDILAWSIAQIGRVIGVAQSVIAWIGEGNDNTDAVFILAANGTSFADSTVEEEVIDGLRDVLEREYWTRTWIVQEVILAKSVEVWCGSRSVSWDDFAECIRQLIDSDVTPDLYNHPAARTIRGMTDRRRCGPSHGHYSIYKLLCDFGHTRCKMPLDQIYAMLSLVTTSSRQGLKVDYNIDSIDLFFRVVILEAGIAELHHDESLVRVVAKSLRLIGHESHAMSDDEQARNLTLMRKRYRRFSFRSKQKMNKSNFREMLDEFTR